MSFFGLSSERGCRAMALLVCVGSWGVLQAADPPPRGRAIEFSHVADQSLVTNKNPISLEAASRPDLSDNLTKSFSLNSGKSSLEGYMAPPSSGVILRSRRAGDQSALNSDWAFTTPEDVMQDYMAQEILNLPQSKSGGLGLGPNSAVERFYQRGASRIHGADEEASPLDPFSLTRDSGTQAGALSAQNSDALSILSPPGSPFRQLMKDISGGGQAGFPDLLRPQLSYDPASEDLRNSQAQAAQEHLEQFKQLFDIQSTPPAPLLNPLPTPPSPLTGLGETGSPLMPAYTGYPALSQANPQPTAYPGVPQAPMPPAAPSYPSASDTSSLAPASTYTPPAMTHADFTAPRRKF